jgi:hypothetical protein
VRPDQAEARLRSLLGEVGVDLGGPFEPDTVRRARAAFKRFAAIPVDKVSREDHSDALLSKRATSRLANPNSAWGCSRQFSFYDDDRGHEGMQQIECSFDFGAVRELLSLSITLWSFEVPGW